MNTAKTNSTIGKESSKTICTLNTGVQSIWDTKLAGFMGYFGRYSKMKKGQSLALFKEARNGFYMVAPVDKKLHVCGRARAVKRCNIAAIQSDIFVTV